MTPLFSRILRAVRCPLACMAVATVPLALNALAVVARTEMNSSPAKPAFTSAQAEAGRLAYAATCGACHGDNLEGGAGPQLAGADFDRRWADGKKSTHDLFALIKASMPQRAPGSLTDAQYGDILSYILIKNGYAAGVPGVALAADTGPLPPPASSLATTAPRSAARAFLATPLAPGKATSNGPGDTEVLEPPAEAWLMYNRSLDGSRFSALDQINTANASQLSPKCIFQTGEVGSFQSSPVIYDGLMYITTAYSTHAVDPVTCAKRWTHAYLDRSTTRITLSRGPALYKGKLFRITPNGHLLALDAKTGTLLWDVLMTDSSLGYWLSGAPVAYDGRVFIGEAGGDSGVNCHIYAFDGESGRWLWTFDTIPTGKQFGADSWKMGSEHGGGSSWSTFALDPVKGLLYASVGNPAPDFHGDVRPGDNLFTDSVVALDYKTGRLNWYAQQVPHDVHDWDTAAAPMLYVQDGRRFMAVASKDGYSYLYDRDSHRLVAKTEVSRHENVDVPLTVQGVHHCPGIVGGVEWNGLAYSPVDRLTFVNSVDYCATTTLQDLNFQVNSSYMGGKVTWDPISQARGFTYGLDGATGKVVWTHESQSPMIAGVTPTAGGVVFTGSIDGDFLVLNSKTGASLYRFNTGGAVAGGVSTYSVNGVQYVAVTSGNASKAAWQSSGAGMVVVFGLPPR